MYKNRDELLKKSREAINVRFKDIVKGDRLEQKFNKGKLGHIIEEDLFEYKINSNKGPDIPELGVEIKVTPFKKLKRGNEYSAKERLVLNVIDYENDHKYEFEDSPFWNKNKTLLILMYLFDENLEYEDMSIKETFYFEYPEEDLKVIKSDYNIIMSKIKKGKAHDLSEKDTKILKACTKGGKNTKPRKQPFSDVRAPQRAYSLKQGYMTHILRDYILGNREDDKIIKFAPLGKPFNLENYISEKIKPYLGNSVQELKDEFDVVSYSNQVNSMIISRIFGVKKISNSVEFIKEGYVFKTIRVERSNSIKESMSFPAFDYREVLIDEFEESQLYEQFIDKTFVFAIFKFDENNIERFENIMFWSMPQEMIEKEIREVFGKTKEVIKSGRIFKQYQKHGKKIRRLNYFPKSVENKVSHIRPHGKDAGDVAILPLEEMTFKNYEYTKMCIWLNSRFIKGLVLELIENSK